MPPHLPTSLHPQEAELKEMYDFGEQDWTIDTDWEWKPGAGPSTHQRLVMGSEKNSLTTSLTTPSSCPASPSSRQSTVEVLEQSQEEQEDQDRTHRMERHKDKRQSTIVHDNVTSSSSSHGIKKSSLKRHKKMASVKYETVTDMVF